MDEELLDKIRFLLKLGEDPRTPPHEAAAAMRAAEQRMREAGLTRKAVREPAAPAGPQPAPTQWVVTDPLLILNDSYRVARLTPPLRFSSHIILIPRRYVLGVTLLEPEDVEQIGWKRGDRVTRAVVLDPAYADDARMHGWTRWN